MSKKNKRPMAREELGRLGRSLSGLYSVAAEDPSIIPELVASLETIALPSGNVADEALAPVASELFGLFESVRSGTVTSRDALLMLRGKSSSTVASHDPGISFDPDFAVMMVVDYDLAADLAIAHCGRPTSPEIKEFCSSGNIRKGSATVSFEIGMFSRRATLDAITAATIAHGCRHASFRELLTLGARPHLLPSRIDLAALGAVMQDARGNQVVPYLHMWEGELSIARYWFHRDLSESFKFLVVREQPNAP